MKICVSYPVSVCCVIFYAKKSRVNQNIEMLLMPLFFRLLFFTHPKSGFGLRLGETVPARSCPVCLALPTAIAAYHANKIIGDVSSGRS